MVLYKSITGYYLWLKSMPFSRVALGITPQSSHRSGRACINASGSSTDRFALRNRSPWLSDRVTWTGTGTSMCSTCFPRSVLSADASLPFTGSSGASSPASTVIPKRCDFLPSIPPRFVAFAWRYLGCTRSFRSSADECAAKAWSWSPGGSSREDAEETTGSPKFLENLKCPFAHVPNRRRRDR